MTTVDLVPGTALADDAAGLLGLATAIAARDRCAAVDPGHLVVAAAHSARTIDVDDLEMCRVDPGALRRGAVDRWGRGDEPPVPSAAVATILAEAAVRAAGRDEAATVADVLVVTLLSPAVELPEVGGARMRLARLVQATEGDGPAIATLRAAAVLFRADVADRMPSVAVRAWTARATVVVRGAVGLLWALVKRLLDAGAFTALAPGILVRELVRTAWARVHGCRRVGDRLIADAGYGFVLRPAPTSRDAARIELRTVWTTVAVGLAGLLPAVLRAAAVGAPLVAGDAAPDLLQADDAAIVAGFIVGGGGVGMQAWVGFACLVVAVPPLDRIVRVTFGLRLGGRRAPASVRPLRLVSFLGWPLDRLGAKLLQNIVFGTGILSLVLGLLALRFVAGVLL